MNKGRCILLILACIILSGCTHVSIMGPREYHQIDHVLIKENPEVIVRGFLGILRDGLSRHGISSDVVLPHYNTGNEYVVTYTALQSWDFTTYLSYAEIRIEKEGRIVASATYRLRGKGGLSFRKWAPAKSKINPVIDQLVYSLRKNTTGNGYMGE